MVLPGPIWRIRCPPQQVVPSQKISTFSLLFIPLSTTSPSPQVYPARIPRPSRSCSVLDESHPPRPRSLRPPWFALEGNGGRVSEFLVARSIGNSHARYRSIRCILILCFLLEPFFFTTPVRQIILTNHYGAHVSVPCCDLHLADDGRHLPPAFPPCDPAQRRFHEERLEGRQVRRRPATRPARTLQGLRQLQ